MCIFCEIIKKRHDASIIYEDLDVIAIRPLDKDIIARGHLLIIPKIHYRDIYEIPLEQLTNLMYSIKLLAAKLKSAGLAEGVNLLHASGLSAQQSVNHFHFHFLPRNEFDQLNTWPNTGYSLETVNAESLDEIYLNMFSVFQEAWEQAPPLIAMSHENMSQDFKNKNNLRSEEDEDFTDEFDGFLLDEEEVPLGFQDLEFNVQNPNGVQQLHFHVANAVEFIDIIQELCDKLELKTENIKIEGNHHVKLAPQEFLYSVYAIVEEYGPKFMLIPKI